MNLPYKKVLWAISDNCPYFCKYCYLKFDKNSNPLEKGSFQDYKKIIASFKDVDIVFLAGAEPLLNANILDIIKEIKSKNIKVVLCTNALCKDYKLYENILNENVDAISISLDSPTKSYNDRFRTKGSWQTVINSIKFIKNYIKINKKTTKVGIYTVISKLNAKLLTKMKLFCENDLGVDYFIYQPITLPISHKLFNELSLGEEEIKLLQIELNKMKQKPSKIYLPSKEYDELMIKGLKKEPPTKCFINNNFIFVMPGGNFSECPCFKAKRSIRNFNDNDDLNFAQISGCKSFSEECTNIYQLLNFNEVLNWKI